MGVRRNGSLHTLYPLLRLPKKTQMPSNIKTYDGSEDPEDHLKIFQAATKLERWAMPTWYHMFNSTLIRSTKVWFDDLPPESVDSYDNLKKAFLANFLQQKKCIKDREILFLSLGDEDGTEGAMIIKVEIGGDTEYSISTWMNFVVVRSPSLYNGIIGRPRERKIQAVLSTAHGMLKFPVPGGILTLQSSKIIPLECTWMSSSKTKEKKLITRKKQGNIGGSGKACGSQHHEGNLNKACPKDGYPLLEIDWKVESLCGYLFKCFLDVYKGYHQIKMAKEDEEKIAFLTSQGIFCYSKMPFGLKNVGATYQRLVDKAFKKQTAKNFVDPT
ncbi:hypothetical protein Tco_0339886 [Tanacetum coccineum]